METSAPPTSESMPGWKKQVTVFLVGQTVTTFGSMLVQYAILWHLTLTTKSGTKLPVSGMKTFSTAKNPASVAAGARGSVRAEANKAGNAAFSAAEGRVTRSKIAAASLASAKAGSTVSTQKQKNKPKK